MPVGSDAPADAYTFAWVALLAILVFFVFLGIVLRRWKRRPVRVTRYQPPQGISPAVAAFLSGGGRYERASAAALVSLATKGYLRILRTADWITFEKLRAADAQLPPEESVAFTSLLPGDFNAYSCSGSDSDRLFETYGYFRAAVSDLVKPELVSSHVVIWFLGLICSLIILAELLVEIAMTMPKLENGLSLGSIGFLCIFIFSAAHPLLRRCGCGPQHWQNSPLICREAIAPDGRSP